MTPPNPAKTAARDQLLTARNRRPLAELRDDARAIAEHVLATAEVRRAATVAAYVSVGTEPGTTELVEELRASGKRVIVPVLLPDNDLAWAAHEGDLRPARFGLLEPPGSPLPPESIGTADVVLVPGLAVSRTGQRLGRGAGCYDRALARVPVGTPVWAVLFDDEVGVDVPVEAHDRPVTGAVSPSGVTRF